MNLPYPNPKWTDGPYAQPRPVGPPIFTAPLPNTSAEYELRQRFQQYLNNLTPVAFNTKHPNYPTYVLVNEGDFKDIGGGVVDWERTYSQVPNSYNEWETFAYQFTGITSVTGINVAITVGRDPYAKRVMSRLQYDFFLAGQTFTPTSDTYSAGVADGNATTAGPGSVSAPYDVAGSIPAPLALIYITEAYDSVAAVWLGGVYFPIKYLGTTSCPTTAQYEGMVEDAFLHGWAAAVSQQYFTRFSPGQMIVNPVTGTPTPNSVYGGQLQAEDALLRRYKGNIWMRTLRFVLAQ